LKVRDQLTSLTVGLTQSELTWLFDLPTAGPP